MSNFTVISANCQGLHDFKKRKDVLHYYKQSQCNILCLQDTHFTSDMENDIRNEWGYEVYFNSFSSKSRGVAIFLNNNFEVKVHKKMSDETGNLLALDLTIENKRMSLITIYGPNNDTPIFYEGLSDIIRELQNQDIILVGDFNLVLDPEKDYFNYLHINNPKARNKVLELIENYNLTDIFREIYPEEKRYTWRKPSPCKQARLDFFLISSTMLNTVEESKILNSYKSDHSPILLKLKINELTHGKGLWKFNNALLYDKQYIETINKVIKETKEYYAIHVYSREFNTDIPDKKIQFMISSSLKHY